MDLDSLKWNDDGLISVIFQDHETGQIAAAHLERVNAAVGHGRAKALLGKKVAQHVRDI